MSHHNTILIVEDNAINLKLFIEILSYYNYSTIDTIDYNQIMKHVRNQDCMLILMDIQLGGISGLDIIKKIRTFDRHIPAIAITAFSNDKTNNQHIIQYGFNKLILKPTSVKEIISTIKNLILQKQES